MTAFSKAPGSARACPFCGVISEGPHESQEGCIAALHTEIDRMRGILATLRPAGVRHAAEEPADQAAATIRLRLD